MKKSWKILALLLVVPLIMTTIEWTTPIRAAKSQFAQTAAQNAWEEESYWADAYLIENEEDLYALARIINLDASDPTFPDDMRRFDPEFSEGDEDPALLAGRMAEAKYSLQANLILPADADFAGIGTPSRPFDGMINGNNLSIQYSIDTANANWTANARYGLFRFVSAALFYQLNIEANMAITGSGQSSYFIGGVVADAEDSCVFDNVHALLNLQMSVPSGAPAVGVGGLVGNAQTQRIVNYDSGATIQSDYAPAGLNTVFEGTLQGTMQEPEEGKLLVTPMPGITVYAYGPRVKKTGDFSYEVEANSVVNLVAVNESKAFARWTSQGGATVNATTMNTSFTMPTNGSGVVLGALVAQDAVLGKSFRNAFTLDDNEDLSALQTIINTYAASTNADFQRFNPSFIKSTANQTALRRGYFRITSNIIADAGFTGIGTGTAVTNAFQGLVDGSFMLGDELHSRTITMTANFNNTATMNGLFGSLSPDTGYHAVVRNVAVEGSLYSKPTGASYAGGIAGYMTKSILVNCSTSAEVNLTYGDNTMYAGGLAGQVSAGYLENCLSFNQSTIKASNTKAFNVYVGGAVGYMLNSYTQGLTVQLGSKTVVNEQASYRPTVIDALGGANTTSTNINAGGVFGNLEMTVAKSMAIRDTLLTYYDAQDSTLKGIYARSPGTANRFVLAGGIAGRISTTAADGLLENTRIDMGEKAQLELVAQDLNTNGSDILTACAGGFTGAFFSSNANQPTLYTDTAQMFRGNIHVIARRYGAGIGLAGGFSARNFCKIVDTSEDGNIVFDISGMTIRNEQKSSYRGTAQTTTLTGGVCAMAQGSNPDYSSYMTGYVIENMSVIGDKTVVESVRENGNSAIDSAASTSATTFSTGGFIGNTQSSVIRNIDVSYTDSSINAHQLSYSSLKGNVSLGGIIGYSSATGITDLSFHALGSTAISGISSTGTAAATKNAHGVGDIYVGGIVGDYNVAATMRNLTFTGDYKKNPAIRTVSLIANQSSNSPSLGGICGYMTSGSFSDVVVDNAYIYGEAYNDTVSATDTDIIVGGAMGLVTGTFATPQAAAVRNTVVKNCNIEAIGREYTLTYAGGVMGSSFSSAHILYNCASNNNRVYSYAQKKWAAAGGVLGYLYDATKYVENCGSFGDRLIAQSTADETYNAKGNFQSHSITGGIIGKVTSAGATGYVRNCYSNASMETINPADRNFRGGLVGWNSNKSTGTAVINSFFDPVAAGTTRSTDLADIPSGSTFIDGNPTDSSKTVAMGITLVKDAEYHSYAALDFSLISLTDEALSAAILTGIQKDGVDYQESPSKPTFITDANKPAVSVDSSAQEKMQVSYQAASPYGFRAQTDGSHSGLVYAVMQVKINGTSYDFNQKPVFLGPVPAHSGVDLYQNSVSSANKLTAPTTSITLDDPDITTKFIAKLAFADDSITDMDYVTWEFSDNQTTPFTPVLGASNMMGYASLALNGNVLSVTPDVQIEEAKVFYLRARSALDPSKVSNVVKLTIVPTYVTGIKITQGVNDENSTANPMGLGKTFYHSVSATVRPDNASLKTYNIVGYKLNQSTLQPLPTALIGIKSDGTISPDELYTTGTVVTPGSNKVIEGELFVVFAVTHAKVHPAWNDSNVAAGWGTIQEDRTLRSAPIYMKVTAGAVVDVIATGVNQVIYPSSGTNAPNSSYYIFETTPLPGYANKPAMVYYSIDGKAPVTFDTTKDVDDKGYAYLNDASRSSRYTIFVPNNCTNIKVYITYFPMIYTYFKCSVNGLLIDVITPRPLSKYVLEEDIPATVSRSGYLFGGWFDQNVQSGSATLADYGYQLKPSRQEIDENGEPIFHDLLPVSDNATSFTLYARWQYNVTIENSASMDTASCENVAQGEAYQTGAPINMFSDLVLRLRKPANYAGVPNYKITINNVAYTLPEAPEWLPDENGGQHADITIPASALAEPPMQGTGQPTLNSCPGPQIKLATYHTNLQLIPTEDDAFAAALPTIPRDGVFTFAYSVNHTRRSASSRTYGYANPTFTNNLRFEFSAPLPKGTTLKLYRRVGANLTAREGYETQNMFYSKLTQDKASFNFSDFRKMGTQDLATVQQFQAFLEPRSHVSEQFFVVVIPPFHIFGANQGLLSNLNVTVGYNNGGDFASSPSTDNKNVVLKGSQGVNGLAEGTLDVTPGSGLMGGSFRFTPPASTPENNTRHQDRRYGVSLSFRNADNTPLTLPNNTVVRYNGAERRSTTNEPIFVMNFRETSGDYSVTLPEGYEFPAGTKLQIQIIEADEESFAGEDSVPPKLIGGDSCATVLL